MKDKDDKLHIPLKERIKSIPEVFGIRVNEEPEYDIVMTEGEFEVRLYPAQTVAKVSLKGMTFDDFRSAAFEKLAKYIFQGNEDHKNIPMTSPVVEQHGTVLQEETEGSGWTMSFILPNKYDVKTAPTPIDQDVILETIPERLIACVRYKGNNSLETIKDHERKLSDWLNAHPNIQSSGRFMIAQYDAPFVIPFLKKNEIHVQIDNMH